MARVWCGCTAPAALGIYESGACPGAWNKGAGSVVKVQKAQGTETHLDLSFPNLSDGEKHLSHLLKMQIPRADAWALDSAGLGWVEEPVSCKSSPLVLMHNLVGKLRPRGRK